MNRSFSVALCLALAFVLEGCTRGIHSGTGGWPPASSTAPAGISSSASVVKVRAADVSIPAGGNADATLTLSISPGYHINANPATFPYLIATAVNPGKAERIIIGTPIYPIAQKKKFQFAEEPLAVYEGEVQISLPLRVEANAGKGGRSLPIELTVQACDAEKCYAPDTLKRTIAIDVK
jgi:thioredoxin:protein disulfide reductase